MKSDNWVVIQMEDGTMHIVPNRDIFPHDLDGQCICKPGVEELENSAILFSHNSFDGREKNE